MSDINIEEKDIKNFIEEFIEEDMKICRYKKIHTRFPPEPNGYLHIGHAKAICIDFGMAEKYNGICNLRFDDTNPSKEDTEYVDSIKEDIKWLGFDWEDRLFYASSYFDKLYNFAIKLIKLGKAYVCDLSADEIRNYRGTLKEPGKNSPYRNRTAEENLDLFTKMKNGEFEDGSKVLRAKIDMSSPNLNMRDPVIYRILRATHHTTGDTWCIYPMYDYAHPISDWAESISHSLCTLEFEDHRPLYNWFLDELELPAPPRQIEFARLNINYTITSKRKLAELVSKGYVSGWDDPRMPTICGLRRRGYPAEAIRNFVSKIGVAKNLSTVDFGLLEHCVRDIQNKSANRLMCVVNPLKVVIDNYPEDKEEFFETNNNPENPEAGSRKIPFSKYLYIEKEDFMEEPARKFFRLSPGKEVRLMKAYFVTCNEIIKDENTGEVIELHCSYDPDSKGGNSPDGRKVKGTLHWVSAKHCIDVEVREYDRLFSVSNPDSNSDEKVFTDYINPESLKIRNNCKAEPCIVDMKPEDSFQFMRLGYYSIDKDTTKDKIVINRTVSLRDSWAKIANK